MTTPASGLGPTIETRRLILRPPTLDDFPRWAQFQSDPETTRFIGGPKSEAEVWRVLMSVAGAWALTGVGFFSVIEKTTGRWLGRIGPWCPHGWPGTEVGWSLHADAMGRGYALEAAVATMDYAVDRLGWSDIVHTIDPDNLASSRLAEKLGSRNRGRGQLPAPFQDAAVDVWGQSAAEWRVNRERFAD